MTSKNPVRCLLYLQCYGRRYEQGIFCVSGKIDTLATVIFGKDTADAS